MATLTDFKLQVKDETGKDIKDAELAKEAQKRFERYKQSLVPKQAK